MAVYGFWAITSSTLGGLGSCHTEITTSKPPQVSHRPSYVALKQHRLEPAAVGKVFHSVAFWDELSRKLDSP